MALYSTRRLAALVLALGLVPPLATASQSAGVDSRERTDVLETAIKTLEDRYVFPEVAERMARALRDHARAGDYDRSSDGPTFAAALTRDMRAVSNDKHIVVDFSPTPLPEPAEDTHEETPEERKAAREDAMREEARLNFGIRKVERLRGNVGYLDVSGFYHAEFGGDALASAMNLLSHTDAMIVDLRDNDGGRPDMVALLASYFFDGSPIQLTGIYWRELDSTRESWTSSYLPGRRYVGKSVYILTSKDTVSAAEGFTYNMAFLKRAKIVGERTAGAANPGRYVRIGKHFMLFVPTGRAVHPVTKTNWEGVGIAPDIAVAAGDALHVAHLEALREILRTEHDAEARKRLEALIEELK